MVDTSYCSTVSYFSVRVSNELGLGRARAAKYSVYVTIFQSLLIGIFCMIVVLATRSYFPIIFTDSKSMRQAVAQLSGLLGITMLLNSIQPVISGVTLISLICIYLLTLVPYSYGSLFRRCCRRRLARNRSVHQFGLLLCFWFAFRVPSCLCSSWRSNGK